VARPSPKTLAKSQVHEWVSFEDPDEDRTWVIDATFLLSSWTCIYGHGCKGVLEEDTTHLAQGCCSYGAHFLDEGDVATVQSAAARLTKEQWQFRKEGKKNGILDKDPDSGDPTTRVVEDACIFLNRPGFAKGPGCALHVGAMEAGERPMDWKPDVCWQLPLRLEEHKDTNGHITSTLREWKRRDWGDAGHDFHWWCTSEPDAFVGHTAVYESLKDEIEAIVEPHIYPLIVRALEEFEKRRVNGTPLPHPAVRRKK